MYVTGGITNSELTLKPACMYDTVRNRWSRLPDLTEERYYHASLVLARTLYIINGENHKKPIAVIEIFRPGQVKWSVFIGVYPISRSDPAAAPITETFFCFFGGSLN